MMRPLFLAKLSKLEAPRGWLGPKTYPRAILLPPKIFGPATNGLLIEEGIVPGFSF